MKNRKRVFLLAALLLLAMTSPARAVKLSEGAKTEIQAACMIPDIEIQVNVPTSGEIFINPYKVPVNVSGRIEDGQIITDDAYIENRSEVPLQVNVVVTGRINPGSDMYLSTVPTQGLTSKRAFIYFEMQAASDPDQVSWDPAYDAEKHLVVRATSRTRKGIAVIGAGGQEKSYGVFRLSGDCVANPKKKEWTEKDGLEVEIVFSFAPLSTTTEIP